MNGKCNECTNAGRYIGPYGDTKSDVAVVGYRPSAMHPKGSDAVFALDIDERARSSAVLDKVFNNLSLDFGDLYWTNTVKCVFDEEVGAQRAELVCMPRLHDEVHDKEVIALGHNAADVVRLTGLDFEQLWHPAYVYRRQEKLATYVTMWETALNLGRKQKTLRWVE